MAAIELSKQVLDDWDCLNANNIFDAINVVSCNGYKNQELLMDRFISCRIQKIRYTLILKVEVIVALI